MALYVRLTICNHTDTFFVIMIYMESILLIIIINLLIIQYPMQFSGPPKILTDHVQHRFEANGGSINITRAHAFHALLLLVFIIITRFKGVI